MEHHVFWSEASVWHPNASKSCTENSVGGTSLQGRANVIFKNGIALFEVQIPWSIKAHGTFHRNWSAVKYSAKIPTRLT